MVESSSANFQHHPSSSSLGASQHLDAHPYSDADTNTGTRDDSRSNSELGLVSPQPPPALTVTSSESEPHVHSYTGSDSDLRQGMETLNSHSHQASIPELDGVTSIINDGGSGSQGDDSYNIKVPAYNVVVGRTPPPSYASLAASSSSTVLASSSRTTGHSPHVPHQPSTLMIPDAPYTPSRTSSGYGSIPLASANPFSNSMLLPTSYSPAFGPTPMNASHPLLAAPHAEEYIEAPGAADRRARWRFAGAVCCAFVVCIGVGGLLVWGEGGTLCILFL